MNTSKKKMTMTIITLLMVVGSFVATIIPNSYSVEADSNPASWALCRDEAGKIIYNTANTKSLQYSFRSKSAATDIDNVDFLYNKLLQVAGFDFVANNEAILGRELNPISIPEINTEEANAAAPKVSAFDRFGVAGLRWSTYLGEWKYYQIDACSNQGRVSNTNYGDFYDGRLEPKSTYDERSTSVDARTIQFNKGFGSTFRSVAGDKVANFIFTISKFFITMTIVLVGLAFTDITTLLGFGVTGGASAGGSAVGIFTTLFNTIFSGFIVITFLFTALYILYYGIIKRQARFALNTILRTVGIFLVAIIISTNPSFWISVPNKAATYGQSIVLSAMSGTFSDTPGEEASLCGTEVSSIYQGTNLGKNTTEDKMLDDFEKIGTNMKSMIGCKMWEQFLLKPWARGQFGADYKDLENSNLDNINSEWVGDAAVPLGNGQYLHNWALFQLSTQTNAHAQIGDNNFPTIINGVNADWWRVADAMSNYDEEEKTDISNLEGEDSVEVNYMAPVDSEPLEYWSSWAGNNTVERSGSAVIAILFGLLGSIVPFSFAMSSAVFGLGITLLMMISPLFLLLGTWGGKGEEVFKGWLSALGNTVLKKIAVSFLLVISIAITLSVMDLIYEIGVTKSFLLLVVITFILMKNKNTLLNMMAVIDFGGAFDPRQGFNRVMNKTNQKSKTVGRASLAMASGGLTGIKTGRGFREGAKIGFNHQVKNELYRSETGMHISRAYDDAKFGVKTSGYVCVVCYTQFDDENLDGIAYRDEAGNFVCSDCADEMGTENLYSIVISGGRDSKDDDVFIYVDSEGVELDESELEHKIKNVDYFEKNVSQEERDFNRHIRGLSGTNNVSHLTYGDVRSAMAPNYDNGVLNWDEDSVQEMISENINNLQRDIVVFTNNSYKMGTRLAPPSIPEPLHEYLDLATINQAWSDGSYGYVESSYKEAWKLWYDENSKHLEDYDNAKVEEFKKVIDSLDFDIDDKEVKEMLHTYDKKVANIKTNIVDYEKDLYVKKHGKLVFNKQVGIDESVSKLNVKVNAKGDIEKDDGKPISKKSKNNDK